QDGRLDRGCWRGARRVVQGQRGQYPDVGAAWISDELIRSVQRREIREGHPSTRKRKETDMYGTVARLRAKPGAQAEIAALAREMQGVKIPGMVADYLYHLDNAPDEYYLVAVFETEAAYVANANSPEQDARYQQLRALLVADPEWRDGEILPV